MPQDYDGDYDSLVLFEVDANGVGLITLNRPQRSNAWNPSLEKRFYEVLDAADTDPAVRACVLTGAGRAFCPGVDSQRLDDLVGRPMDLTGRRSPAWTFAFRKPLIAAINGACAGLGMVQALMCDVRFAARGARFATAFARRGLAGEYGMTWLLPRLVGPELALDLLLSGRTFDADEAHRIGLVSRLVEPGELLAAARGYARELARHSAPASMAMIKHQVLTDLDADYASATRRAYRAMAYLADQPDFREGMDSYLDKRQPDFRPLPGELRPAQVVGAAMAALDVDPMKP